MGGRIVTLCLRYPGDRPGQSIAFGSRSWAGRHGSTLRWQAKIRWWKQMDCLYFLLHSRSIKGEPLLLLWIHFWFLFHGFLWLFHVPCDFWGQSAITTTISEVVRHRGDQPYLLFKGSALKVHYVGAMSLRNPDVVYWNARSSTINPNSEAEKALFNSPTHRKRALCSR